MIKQFNVNGACKPDRHYMVELGSRLEEIRKMIDDGAYFSINRARQYGKTTILRALAEYLKKDYFVLSLDFQRMSYLDFEQESSFVHGLAREILRKIKTENDIAEEIKEEFVKLADKSNHAPRMAEIFDIFSAWCGQTDKPVVFIVDEVDTATNNQVFLDFLAQLRAAYLDSDVIPTFQSVILAGVYDIRSMQRKIRQDEEHKENSPWNIAADFLVDMSFSIEDIMGMLEEYEEDYHTGMDIRQMAVMIDDYTSGYPYLVSRICKLIDEYDALKTGFDGWCQAGVAEAVRMILKSSNTLFDDMQKKLMDDPELKRMIYSILFGGKSFPYYPVSQPVKIGVLFGFIKEENEQAVIANRIFETFFYDLFLAEDILESKTYDAALLSRNQFVKNGILDMELILTKFLEHYHEIYSNSSEKFAEEHGRKLFLLYLKPIINGTGNYYIESRTRSMGRTDVVIDYLGRQTVVELKVWRGNEYHKKGEKQLAGYLEDYHLEKGYLLSFCFNKNKKIGKRVILCEGKRIVEVVV